MSPLRWACCLLWASLALAQSGRTVDDLVNFIRSAIQAKYDDKKIADEVAKIRLVNRLDDNTVQMVQHMGAGQKTMAAVHKLAESSANLPAGGAAPKVAPAALPPPAPEELKEILAAVRQNALNYTESLPNYVCTQYTKRKVDPTGTQDWRLADTVTEQLSYVDHKENYKVVMVNDRVVAPGTQHDQLGGAKSSGEFASILRTIFDPDSQAEFEWDRWTTLQTSGRTYVFRFRVGQQRYRIDHQASKRSIVTGFHGQIYVNQESKMVMGVKMECDDIPADFPIQSVTVSLSYDTVEISGQKFVLPLLSEVRSREGKFLSWNEVSYHSYHKYSSDASISFDAPDAEPAKPPAKKKN
jgi:hypothetical protein